MANSLFLERQQQLKNSLTNNNITAIALNPGPDLSYMTNLDFHLSERPVIGLFPSNETPILILPELEQAKMALVNFEITPYFYSEDQSTWSDVFKKALSDAELNDKVSSNISIG